MVYEDERKVMKKEEKYLTVFLISGIIVGILIGMYFKNIILYFSIFGVIGLLVGSIFNMIERNKKISK